MEHYVVLRRLRGVLPPMGRYGFAVAATFAALFQLYSGAVFHIYYLFLDLVSRWDYPADFFQKVIPASR